MTPTLKRFAFQAMGGYCEIQLYDESRINAKRLCKKLTTEVSRLEMKYSRFRRDSFLTQINLSAGSTMGIQVDSETRKLFDHALTCFEQSEGLFDVTAGRLNRLWDFRSARVPPAVEIEQALSHTGFSRLKWRKTRLYVPAGMEIDFGGIVKEYAADTIANLARKLGVQNGLVNLGGDFAVIGPRLDGSPWPVGIANPKQPDSLMAKINIADGGLASSGDYERCFVHDGKRYSHILNPKTGWPCDGLRAVSVAANLCTVAGSIATIAMLKTQDDGVAFLKETGLPHVYMDSDEEVAGEGLAPLASNENAEPQAAAETL